MSGVFVRRVRHYPRLTLRARDVPAAAGMVRRLDARPGRFILLNPRTRTPDWQIPAAWLSPGELVGPLQPAMYLARVEDVTSAGACAVTLWEVPNGLAGTTTLTPEHLGELRPEVGDTLRVYTWIEVPRAGADGFGPERPRVKVEAPPLAPPDEAMRAALRAALAMLDLERKADA